MKNITAQNKQNEGFTLIELLIAITILAILSVIGYSIFANIQKGARDSQRRIQVDALAKNVESTFDPSSKTYTYSNGLYLDDYPQNKAMDPLNSTTDLREYCANV